MTWLFLLFLLFLRQTISHRPLGFRRNPAPPMVGGRNNSHLCGCYFSVLVRNSEDPEAATAGDSFASWDRHVRNDIISIADCQFGDIVLPRSQLVSAAPVTVLLIAKGRSGAQRRDWGHEETRRRSEFDELLRNFERRPPAPGRIIRIRLVHCADAAALRPPDNLPSPVTVGSSHKRRPAASAILDFVY